MSVSQCYVIRRNLISLQPPPEADRNGVIIRYDIFYLEEEEEEETNTTLASPRVFSVAEYTPSDPEASGHSTRLGGLAGGKRYLVKMRAATSVGAGPNSTLVSIVTLEREKTNSLLSFSPFTSSLHLSFLSFMIISLRCFFPSSLTFFYWFFIVSFSPSIPPAAGPGDRSPGSQPPTPPLPPRQPLSLLPLLLPQVSGWETLTSH